jgi:hypothetical protein
MPDRPTGAVEPSDAPPIAYEQFPLRRRQEANVGSADPRDFSRATVDPDETIAAGHDERISENDERGSGSKFASPDDGSALRFESGNAAGIDGVHAIRRLIHGALNELPFFKVRGIGRRDPERFAHWRIHANRVICIEQSPALRVRHFGITGRNVMRRRERRQQ